MARIKLSPARAVEKVSVIKKGKFVDIHVSLYTQFLIPGGDSPYWIVECSDSDGRKFVRWVDAATGRVCEPVSDRDG